MAINVTNDCLNSTVWALAPKSISCGEVTLDLGTNIAVCVYNGGLSSIMRIMDAMGIKMGSNSNNLI